MSKKIEPHPGMVCWTLWSETPVEVVADSKMGGLAAWGVTPTQRYIGAVKTGLDFYANEYDATTEALEEAENDVRIYKRRLRELLNERVNANE